MFWNEKAFRGCYWKGGLNDWPLKKFFYYYLCAHKILCKINTNWLSNKKFKILIIFPPLLYFIELAFRKLSWEPKQNVRYVNCASKLSCSEVYQRTQSNTIIIQDDQSPPPTAPIPSQSNQTNDEQDRESAPLNKVQGLITELSIVTKGEPMRMRYLMDHCPKVWPG